MRQIVPRDIIHVTFFMNQNIRHLLKTRGIRAFFPILFPTPGQNGFVFEGWQEMEEPTVGAPGPSWKFPGRDTYTIHLAF